MRLVIDLQGAQGGNRARGVGRYSRALALALAGEAGRHEVIIALNGAFEETTAELRDAFAGVLPPEHVQVWTGPGRQTAGLAADAPRRRAAERIRAGFIETLRPDAVLATSLLEGLDDDAVATVPRDMAAPPCVTVCYGAAATVPGNAAAANTEQRRFLHRAWLDLQHSAGLLAVSTAGQAEIAATLEIEPDRIAPIPAGVSPPFAPFGGGEPDAAVLSRYGVQGSYVLCRRR